MLIQKNATNVNSLRMSGCRYGLRQPSIRLNLELELSKAPDFSAVDKDLLERFGIEQPPINLRINRQLTESEQAVLQFAWRTLGLACGLLQAINIPCLDQGIILDLRAVDQKRHRYKVTCQFPYVEHHSPSWIGTCVSWSYRLLSQWIAPATTEVQVEEMLEALHKDLIAAALHQVAGGNSSVPVLKTAFQMDIPFLHLGSGVYQLGWGSKRHLADRSSSELDSALGARISHDKLHATHQLRQAGLPAPTHHQANTPEAAIEAAMQLGFPVVIKPADKDRGEGVTVDIHDAEGVTAAFDRASKLSKKILVEKQVPGICYRILVIGETSPYTVARLPLAVEGDGIHTVRDLISHANAREARKAKHRREKPFPSDELAEQMLKSQGFDFDSIPDPGVHARLRPIETTEWGGLPKVFSDQIHPENRRIALQAAKMMNLHIAGVDLISTDISKAWHENGAVINEVNFAPYLSLHYDYQRAGVKQLVRELFPQGGRIPVEIFIGDELAWNAALDRQRALVSAGVRTFISSHSRTVDAGSEISLAITGADLYARSRALLMNSDVEALLLVVQTDELLAKGLPVDSVNAITLVNNNIVVMNDVTRLSPAKLSEMLVELFSLYHREMTN